MTRRHWMYAWSGAALAACLIAGLGSLAPSTAKDKPDYGSITTFATVPADPGFPEGIAIHGNFVYVSGPARFGTAGTGPSAIQVYNRHNASLEQTLYVDGEELSQEHAVSNIAVDGDGNLYALSTQLGLIRFVKQGQSYVQEAYGDPLPELMFPPATFFFPPIVNDIVFDDMGFAYVTDSLQATIFRYPPGGGAPEIWFQSELFEGGGFFPFGTNGIRLDPQREHVYVVSSTSALNPNLGTIYRLPLVDAPTADDLEVFCTYPNGEIPDQLAFAENGTLYVTLAGSSQISVVGTDGVELTRISSQPSDDIPLDGPAGLVFDSRTKSVLVCNHAPFSGMPEHFAVLKVYVGAPGDPLSKP